MNFIFSVIYYVYISIQAIDVRELLAGASLMDEENRTTEVMFYYFLFKMFSRLCTDFFLRKWQQQVFFDKRSLNFHLHQNILGFITKGLKLFNLAFSYKSEIVISKFWIPIPLSPCVVYLLYLGSFN